MEKTEIGQLVLDQLPNTVAEIMLHTGLAKITVHRHLAFLVSDNLCHKNKGELIDGKRKNIMYLVGPAPKVKKVREKIKLVVPTRIIKPMPIKVDIPPHHELMALYGVIS
ncbi:MAG: hypothetical protein V4493_01160 [Pseudomonadota bacterium]